MAPLSRKEDLMSSLTETSVSTEARNKDTWTTTARGKGNFIFA